MKNFNNNCYFIQNQWLNFKLKNRDNIKDYKTNQKIYYINITFVLCFIKLYYLIVYCHKYKTVSQIKLSQSNFFQNWRSFARFLPKLLDLTFYTEKVATLTSMYLNIYNQYKQNVNNTYFSYLGLPIRSVQHPQCSCPARQPGAWAFWGCSPRWRRFLPAPKSCPVGLVGQSRKLQPETI